MTRGCSTGKSIGVDATVLEANAAMKWIVRKGTGEDWKAYLKVLAQEAGIESPTDTDLQRFDMGRGFMSALDLWMHCGIMAPERPKTPKIRGPFARR